MLRFKVVNLVYASVAIFLRALCRQIRFPSGKSNVGLFA